MRWGPHDVQVQLNQYYTLDDFPIRKSDSGDFAVTFFPGGESVTLNNGQVAAWQGGGAPSRGDCTGILGGAGSDHVQIESQFPGGLPPGSWLCGQTQAGHVLRLKYLGLDSSHTLYSFSVTVWNG